jgi:repressor LexA
MVSTMNALHAEPTARQRQILELIAQFLARHARPPTRGELAAALGLRNRQGIDQHLRALAAKGLIALEPGLARGIRLLHGVAGVAPGVGPGVAEAPGDYERRYPTRPEGLPLVPPPRLPLYGRVAAGVPTLALGNLEDELPLDPALFRPRADFLLRVHGQSMRDADIHDRDILAVHRTGEARNGQVVVARLGDEATVKIYRRRGQLLRLEPANPDFQPIEVDLQRESCTIEGCVVGLLRLGLPRLHAGRASP